MKARRTVIVALGVCLGTGFQALASESVLSSHYKPLNKQRAENQVNSLKQDRMTQKDLISLSADVRDVNVLIVSPSDIHVVPASNRPSGSLQLDKIIVEPK